MKKNYTIEDLKQATAEYKKTVSDFFDLLTPFLNELHKDLESVRNLTGFTPINCFDKVPSFPPAKVNQHSVYIEVRRGITDMRVWKKGEDTPDSYLVFSTAQLKELIMNWDSFSTALWNDVITQCIERMEGENPTIYIPEQNTH